MLAARFPFWYDPQKIKHTIQDGRERLSCGWFIKPGARFKWGKKPTNAHVKRDKYILLAT